MAEYALIVGLKKHANYLFNYSILPGASCYCAAVDSEYLAAELSAAMA